MSITSQSVKTSVQHTIDRFFRKRKQDGDISVELKAQWQQDIDDRRGQKKQREANAADTDVRRRPGRSCHAPTDAEAGQLVWVQFNIMDYSQVLVTLNSAPIAPAIKHTHTWTIEENEDAPSHVWTYQQTVDTVKNSALKPGRKSSCLLASDDDNEDCLGTPGGDASAAVQYTSSQQPYGSQTPATEKGKPYLEFKDAIHGFCKLHRDLKPWIDTSVFQRLRELKQLGCTQRVFSAAEHSRFVHSLGVAHLAGLWYRLLMEHSNLPHNPKHELLLQLAGLLHDIGHAPFSHVFEKEVLPRCIRLAEASGRRVDEDRNGEDVEEEDFVPSSQPGPSQVPRLKAWHHEDMSEVLIDYMFDHFIDQEQLHMPLTPADLVVVKAMIKGEVVDGWQDEYSYMFRIVANKQCEVDVDKLDYLLRDGQVTGAKSILDIERIFNRSKVVQGELAFDKSAYEVLLSVFTERQRLHQRVYQHPKTKAVEFMVGDALALAEPALRLLARLGSPQAFCTLDDTVYRQLEVMDPEATKYPAQVRAAQALLARVARRSLYKFVGESGLKEGEGLPSAVSLLERVPGEHSGCGLEATDIETSLYCVNWGKKNENPLDYALFYGGYPNTTCLAIPRRFQERRARVYCKSEDPAKQAALRAAVDAWCVQRGDFPPECSLPLSSPQDTPLFLSTPALTMGRKRPHME